MNTAISTKSTLFDVHFGGPDMGSGALRNLLSERIKAVPPGGNIDWVTYYFRDRALARDLIDAARRGVRVRLTLEQKPRIASANGKVIAMLSGRDGLGPGLRTIALPGIPSPKHLAWKPQVHEKIYCFSHPEPIAFLGSFNPSSDDPEETPDILHEIGDHNIAHNLLVGIRDPKLVSLLIDHTRKLNSSGSSLLYRFSCRTPSSLDCGHTVLHFWPRLRAHPMEELLARFGAGSRVRIAASHIRNPGSVDCMIDLARRGSRVEVLSEHTKRRVPHRTEQRLAKAGVSFRRLGEHANVPMHLKFVLAENGFTRRAAFGSFNWTLPSYWLNHEIAAITSDDAVFRTLDDHWNHLLERT